MKDLLFEQRRATALLADCDYCGQPAGKRCIDPRTKHELVNQVAHFVRVTAGQKVVAQ